jgi:hypothetical protein
LCNAANGEFVPSADIGGYEVNVEALIRTSRENRDRVGLRSLFRPAFLRDRSVCFNYGIVESPTGNRAHTIEAGEDA